MLAEPNTEVTAVVDWGIAALVGTITIKIVDVPDGNVVVAATTSGIVETANGIYSGTFTTPVNEGSYLIVWEVGTDDVAEELEVSTETTPTPLVSPYIYITVADFKSTISATGTTYLDDDIETALGAASRGVDFACSKRRLRRFYTDVVDVVRYFSAADGQNDLVEIFDANAITSVELDSDGDGVYDTELTLTTDYVMWPFNAPVDDEPWTHIKIMPQSEYRLNKVPGLVKVTGQWGWTTVPPGVVEATGLVAARLLKRKREAPFGVVGFGMDQAAAITIARNDPDVVSLLKPFMRDRKTVVVHVE